MFERFTEKARRIIFFARYEASNLGGRYIETEHLLLGLLREDKELASRFLLSYAAADLVRKRITEGLPAPEKISTSVDMPLSHQCKRVLAYAAEEAGSSGETIGTEHILLGLLREDKGLASGILREWGLELPAVREKLQGKSASPVGRGHGSGLGLPWFKLIAVDPRLQVADTANPMRCFGGDGEGRHVICQNMTMKQFAENLPSIAPGYIRGGVVVDETGLVGAWDFTLHFFPAVWARNDRTSLFEALEEQLGLKLERTPRPGLIDMSSDGTPPACR